MTRAEAEQLEEALSDWLSERLPGSDDDDYHNPKRRRDTREVLIEFLATVL